MEFLFYYLCSLQYCFLLVLQCNIFILYEICITWLIVGFFCLCVSHLSRWRECLIVYIGLTISDNKILITDTSLELFNITILPETVHMTSRCHEWTHNSDCVFNDPYLNVSIWNAIFIICWICRILHNVTKW
jgi:hypothetical protein